ncbi:hypothetical protein FH972_005107 [Carpinus fangiana]|uniref:Uncharacterized protein n=1 Tax=Carpinus fangiana TaxID=176857 RepID=A0A5N6QRR8_9ROSI|nr:hypothetical protein FH972_005107 [Carpinus fangiana]
MNDRRQRGIWLKQKRKKEHRFRLIGRTVSYDTEVMGFMEEHRMRRLTGVKSKELLIWVSFSEVYIDDLGFGKITFANPTRISKTF